jgi:putative ABC transport system substrate-binding protein
LRDLGWVEGNNVAFEWVIADGHNERLPALAAELVRRTDIIVTGGTPEVLAVRAASTSIPVVMSGVGDPVASGLVESLSHPGGNVTGVTQYSSELRYKRLELLKQAIPMLTTLVYLYNGSNPANAQGFPYVVNVAASMGIQIYPLDVRSPETDLSADLAWAAPTGADALLCSADGLFLNTLIGRIVDVTAEARLPAMYFAREFVDAGGLMAYAPNLQAIYRRAASYVDRVLKGAKPADLPVEQPAVFEFVANQGVLQALGISLPPEVTAQVTEWVHS